MKNDFLPSWAVEKHQLFHLLCVPSPLAPLIIRLPALSYSPLTPQDTTWRGDGWKGMCAATRVLSTSLLPSMLVKHHLSSLDISPERRPYYHEGFWEAFVSTLIQILISWALSLTIHCMHISAAAIIHICSMYLPPDRGDLSLSLRPGPFAVTQPVHKLTQSALPVPRSLIWGERITRMPSNVGGVILQQGGEASVFLAFNDSSWAGKTGPSPGGHERILGLPLQIPWKEVRRRENLKAISEKKLFFTSDGCV